MSKFEELLATFPDVYEQDYFSLRMDCENNENPYPIIIKAFVNNVWYVTRGYRNV